MMAVYLSGLYPTSIRFWFSATGDFQAIHVAIAFVGAVLVGWSLWRLTTLCEEDEGYFITPFGSSRLELILTERLKGRKIARGKLGDRFSDRWHNRLLTLSENPIPATLSQYGWVRFSHAQQAIAAGLAIALYGLLLGCLARWIKGEFTAGPSFLVSAMTFDLPALGATFVLQSRRVRMASELLRPASRTAYFDGLFRSMAKLTLYFWLAASAGTWVVSMLGLQSFEGDFMQLAIGYLLLSLAVQFPAFAIGLRMAQWQSTVLFALGCCVLGIAELGLLASWIYLQEEAGPILVASIAAVLLIAAGVPLLGGARKAWLRAELG